MTIPPEVRSPECPLTLDLRQPAGPEGATLLQETGGGGAEHLGNGRAGVAVAREGGIRVS